MCALPVTQSCHRQRVHLPNYARSIIRKAPSKTKFQKSKSKFIPNRAETTVTAGARQSSMEWKQHHLLLSESFWDRSRSLPFPGVDMHLLPTNALFSFQKRKGTAQLIPDPRGRRLFPSGLLWAAEQLLAAGEHECSCTVGSHEDYSLLSTQQRFGWIRHGL